MTIGVPRGEEVSDLICQANEPEARDELTWKKVVEESGHNEKEEKALSRHAAVSTVVLGVQSVQDRAGDEDLGPDERGWPDLESRRVSM